MKTLQAIFTRMDAGNMNATDVTVLVGIVAIVMVVCFLLPDTNKKSTINK